MIKNNFSCLTFPFTLPIALLYHKQPNTLVLAISYGFSACRHMVSTIACWHRFSYLTIHDPTFHFLLFTVYITSPAYFRHYISLHAPLVIACWCKPFNIMLPCTFPSLRVFHYLHITIYYPTLYYLTYFTTLMFPTSLYMIPICNPVSSLHYIYSTITSCYPCILSCILSQLPCIIPTLYLLACFLRKYYHPACYVSLTHPCMFP